MSSKKRVLIIDDESRILRFVSASLSLAGYEAVITTSGEEGLQLADSAKPDIVLLDLVMEPLTGFDVLVKLRKFSQVPVIMLTGRDDISATAKKEGANGFLSKPFRPEQMIKTIEDILGSHKENP